MLEIKNLTVGLKKDKKILKALDNVSFKINESEILGLAGESGCGKSLSALAITNLLPEGFKFLNGEIIFKNKSLTEASEKELCGIRGKEISIIFQDARQALNPLMKVGKQISEMLEQITDNKEQKNNKKRREDYKKQVLEILAALGFEEPSLIYEAYPHQLSGGMCQKVMTAIAAISKPSLLIADEPSSALDEESQNSVLSLLMDLNRNFKTSLLIISHDISIIRKYCSRFLIMYAGKIIEEGPAQELQAPLHPYTNALIGAIPAKEKRGQPLQNIPGKVPAIEDNFSGCPFAPRCNKAQNVCFESFPPALETEKARRVYCYFPITAEGNNIE